MKYHPADLQKAKDEGLALFKIELDLRFAPKTGIKKRQCWGAASPELQEKIVQLLRETN